MTSVKFWIDRVTSETAITTPASLCVLHGLCTRTNCACLCNFFTYRSHLHRDTIQFRRREPVLFSARFAGVRPPLIRGRFSLPGRNEMGSTNFRTAVLLAVIATVSMISIQPAGAQGEKPSYTLITNVNIFDGMHDRLTPGSVLIENNLSKSVGIDVKTPQGTTVIDGGERTLIHTTRCPVSPSHHAALNRKET